MIDTELQKIKPTYNKRQDTTTINWKVINKKDIKYFSKLNLIQRQNNINIQIKEGDNVITQVLVPEQKHNPYIEYTKELNRVPTTKQSTLYNLIVNLYVSTLTYSCYK